MDKTQLQKDGDSLIEYFKKESTQEKVAALAVQIKKVFGWQWFTLEDCSNIFRESPVDQLVDIIRSLDLCGFLIVNNKKSTERYRLSASHFNRVISVD